MRRSIRRSALRVLLVLNCVAVLGNQSNCDGNPATLTCDPLAFTVEAGTCTEFTNPCGDHQWHRLDGFQLCGGPPGLTIRSETRPRARYVCASPATATSVDTPVDYYYVTPTDTGEGTMLVTVGIPSDLSVTAASFPASIQPGGSALLLVTSVSGGAAPYAYDWAPAETLDRPDAPDPLASPSETTTYTVTVTDSNGVTGTADATVFLGFDIAPTATPVVIDPGESSQLDANPGGGTAPYGYAWMPAASLDDPTSATPIATPTVTTTYQVEATDDTGAVVSGSATVEVRLAATASATLGSIDPGQSAQLEVVAEGGTPPYLYAWGPTDSLDDFTVADPIATPAASTLYRVTVADSVAHIAQAEVPVYVRGTGPLAACFTIAPFGPAGTTVGLLLDASCSTGELIVEYRWWWDYESGQLPDRVSVEPCCQEVSYLASGVKRLRVEVLDDTGATDALTVDFDFQP